MSLGAAAHSGTTEARTVPYRQTPLSIRTTTEQRFSAIHGSIGMEFQLEDYATEDE